MSGSPRSAARRSCARVDDLIAAFDAHLGTPDDVAVSLQADTALARSTDLAVQVHSVDPPHPFILRSIELMAEKVAPALGWRRDDFSQRSPSGLRGSMTVDEADVIDTLVGIEPGSALHAIRARRPDARIHAQVSYRVLFAPESPGDVTAQERFAVATFVVACMARRTLLPSTNAIGRRRGVGRVASRGRRRRRRERQRPLRPLPRRPADP